MRPCTFIARCLGLAAVLFLAACGSDDAQTCLSNQDCAPSQYCAQSGGVFFSSSRCLDRSLFATDDVHPAEDTEDKGYRGNEEDTGLSELSDVIFADDSSADIDASLPVACTHDDDCAEPEDLTTSTECLFESSCVSSGTMIVTTRVSRCEDNLCVVHETTDTETCTRPTPSGPCGEPVQTEWGDCDFGTNVCATTGTQSRSITTPTCSNNSCQQIQSTETRDCSRPDPAVKCKPDSQSWSLCEASSTLQTCDLTGVRYLSTTTWSCDAGQCKPTTVQNPEPQSCERNTNGLACTLAGNNGVCLNGCCDVYCPPGKQCLKCMLD